MTEREQQLAELVLWLAKQVRLVKGKPHHRFRCDVHADPDGWWQAWICDGWEGAEYGNVDDPPHEHLLIETLGGIDARDSDDA